MKEETLSTSSPIAIEGLIEKWSPFAKASYALENLTSSQATTKLEGWPYSIAEIVAHMLFWQLNDFETIETGVEPHVDKNTDWPSVTENDWPKLKEDFLTALEKSKQMALNENLERPILENKFTVGLRMVWFTGHNAYHLGQIILMRRIINAWTPYIEYE